MDVFEGDTRNHGIIVNFMSQYFSHCRWWNLFWNYCINRKAAFSRLTEQWVVYTSDMYTTGMWVGRTENCAGDQQGMRLHSCMVKGIICWDHFGNQSLGTACICIHWQKPCKQIIGNTYIHNHNTINRHKEDNSYIFHSLLFQTWNIMSSFYAAWNRGCVCSLCYMREYMLNSMTYSCIVGSIH